MNRIFFLQWHITNACNLKCIHCYSWKEKQSQLSFDGAKFIVNDFVHFLKKFEFDGIITITGGEPLLAEYLIDLLDYIDNQDCKIKLRILTNGHFLNDNLIRIFKRLDIIIEISFEGIGGVHDSVAGQGSYENSIAAVKKLVYAGVNCSTRYIIMRRNVNLFSKFVFKMQELGIKRINIAKLTQVEPFLADECLNEDELRKVFEEILLLQKSTIVDIISGKSLQALAGKVYFCPLKLNVLVIDSNGDFMPCRTSPIPIGNIFRDSFDQIWNRLEFLKKISQGNIDCKQCEKNYLSKRGWE